MREIIANEVKSFVVNDTTRLHVVKLSDKKFVVARVGEKTATVEQLSPKQMKEKFNIKPY